MTYDMFNTLGWAVFPYVCMVTFIVGTAWRYRYDKFGWTTRSSQLYDSALLRIGSPLFHFGIIGVAAGHFVGLLIPKSWTEAVGVKEFAYHFLATYVGMIAALATVVGLALLIYRRRRVGPVFLATTKMDKFMYVLLVVPIVLGTVATVNTQLLGAGHGYDYRETISPWLRSLFYGPKPELMLNVPVTFKLHITAAFLLFAVWPFTRLVHAFSAPVTYPLRPYIVYRSRNESNSTRDPNRGWEPSTAPKRRSSTKN